jgi:O-6-methylguanine DNA methyltransferase
VRVWQQLREIPFGSTCTYGELAATIGHPSAFRAVGGANGHNWLPIFVPCHRVLAVGGKLGGFTGGIGLKKRLLAHEAAVLGSRAAAAD